MRWLQVEAISKFFAGNILPANNLDGFMGGKNYLENLAYYLPPDF